MKRSNDVFEEEVEVLINYGVSREDAEYETYLFLPEEARWENIKKETENICIALDRAFAAIESYNTSGHVTSFNVAIIVICSGYTFIRAKGLMKRISPIVPISL